MKHILNVIISISSTIAIYCLGGWDITIQLFTLIVMLDYISGVCKAIYNKELNSTIGLQGIIKKIGYFIIISISVILDKIIANTGSIRTVVIYFFIANEGLSVVENWHAMGLPLPKQITRMLTQLKNDNDKEEEKTK